MKTQPKKWGDPSVRTHSLIFSPCSQLSQDQEGSLKWQTSPLTQLNNQDSRGSFPAPTLTSINWPVHHNPHPYQTLTKIIPRLLVTIPQPTYPHNFLLLCYNISSSKVNPRVLWPAWAGTVTRVLTPSTGGWSVSLTTSPARSSWLILGGHTRGDHWRWSGWETELETSLLFS